MVIGVTGGIGTGKSTVLNYIKQNFDVDILLTDDIAKEFMQPNGISYNLIVDYFGDKILNNNKEINNIILSKIVFSDKEKLEKLNSFTHPYVIQYVRDYIKENNNRIIFIESALLMETKLKDLCNKIVYIDTDLDIRRLRLKKYRNYTDERINEVLKNQKNIYMENMILIKNNSLEEMKNYVNKLMEDILNGLY